MDDVPPSEPTADIIEQRFQFFADKGTSLAFEQDRLFATLFTGIVAGLLALLVAKDVSFWSALFFVLAALAAIVGLGACLLHMTFGAKTMLALAAILGGEENVPNLIGRQEPTVLALNKNRVFAQMCYASELVCLLCSVFLAALGVIAHVWDILGWMGLTVAVLFTLGLVIATLRPLLIVYRLSRLALVDDENGDATSSGAAPPPQPDV